MQFIRDPSLVLYLPLYELDGTTFASKDAYGHIVTATTAPWTFMGREFDGATGLLTVPDATSIQNIFDGGGTIECWINLDSDGEGDVGRFIDKQRWNLRVSNEAAGKTKIRFACVFSGDNGTWTSTSTEININAWSHIVLTYNSSSVDNNPIIYVNGSSVTLTETTPTGTRTSDATADLIIGNEAGDSSTFDGTIGEVRGYTRILNPQEVNHNFLATRWRYR